MSKEKKNEPLRFGKHGDAAVSAPRYVRKIGKGYEYGEIEVNWDDRTKDKNRPLGKAPTLDEALEDAIHSAYDWISLELTEEEPDFPPVSDVADLGKSEGEIARNIAVNIRLFEGWDE